ncbi:MAG: acetolactate synthase 2 small subunit [Enterobacteriaceae bacterium]
MSTHHLIIRASSRPEMLERILRVVRHRGFRVYAMNMVSAGQGDAGSTQQMTLQLTVMSDRPLELLVNQLEKLLYISQVEIERNAA